MPNFLLRISFRKRTRSYFMPKRFFLIFLHKLGIKGLSALENFVTFSVKPDWLGSFLLMNCVGAATCVFIQERAAFAENHKSSRSELFFKIAVLKHFTNFPKTIRGGVFLLGKINKLYILLWTCS